MAHSLLHSIGQNGIPIGHKSMNLSKKKYWHPLVADFLLGTRHKTAVFNPFLGKKMVLQAFYVLALIVRNNGHILLVNTNPEYSNFIKNLSSSNPNISHCCYKWVGGTLTNWKQVSKSVLTFAKFSQRCENFLQKNNLNFPRYKKVQTFFQGLITNQENLLAFSQKPDVIVIVNPNENQNVIQEANKLHIPIIGFIESNTKITGITYPIPLNVYSLSTLYYCLKKLYKISRLIKPLEM